MSKNDKRELFFTEENSREWFEDIHAPKFTAEFGYHHELFLRQIHHLVQEPLLSSAVGDFVRCKKEYDCLLLMKEDLENRINQAIDDIDNLLPNVSDETAAQLTQIKQNLWQTGEMRWLEWLWNIERDTNEAKIG